LRKFLKIFGIVIGSLTFLLIVVAVLVAKFGNISMTTNEGIDSISHSKIENVKLEPLKLKDVEATLFNDKSKVVIVWASWCKPCKFAYYYFKEKGMEENITLICVDKNNKSQRELSKETMKNSGMSHSFYLDESFGLNILNTQNIQYIIHSIDSTSESNLPFVALINNKNEVMQTLNYFTTDTAEFYVMDSIIDLTYL